MKNRYLIAISALLLLFSLQLLWAGDEDVPLVRSRVNDQTGGTLTGSEMEALERKIAGFEQESSNQIVVLIISSLGSRELKEFSYSFAEKNKIGKKERNNGVLLLIAKEERQVDIEVGYGLEGALTDAVSGQIIRKIIAPRFREGDYYGGINDAVDAIISVTKGEFKGDRKTNAAKKFSPLVIILLILFFGIFPRIFGGGRRSTIGSNGYRSSFPWWWGGFGGGGGGGGFGGGGFGGGGMGGFSGGGGSFGGGGASGSW